MSDSWVELGKLIGSRIRGTDADSQVKEQRAERQKAEAKHAKTMQALIDSYADLLPDSEAEELRNQNQLWGAEEREGYIKAQALSAGVAEARQRQGEQRSMQALTELLGQFEQPQTTRLPSPNAPGVLPGLNVQTRPRLTADTLRQLLPQRPAAINNPRTLELLKILETGDEVAGTPPNIAFSEDPETGARFATFGNVLQPSGVNPKRAGAAVPITGPNGEVLGMGLPGRSTLTPIPTGAVKDRDKYNRLSKQVETLISAQGRAAYSPQLVESYQKQIDALAAELQALETETPGTPKPGGARSRYKLVNGQLQLVE